MNYRVIFTITAASVAAESAFEPAEFNITEALLEDGVNVSAIATLLERSPLSGCPVACASLKVIFGDDQVETEAESAYNAFVTAFWSAQQREMSPQCVFKPEKSLNVSTAILLARLTQCPFAAKSGGHSAVPRGSNIDGGLTISFEKIDKLTLSNNKKIASFQPGHTWFDIYSALEKDNLAVIGGRVASVGVGGLTLGGGISYFSSEYGLACDNVESYELVTASGLIINASPAPFLTFIGLCVTTIPRAPTMWGGRPTYRDTQFAALIEAYYNLGMNAKEDGKAHQILSFGWGGVPVVNVKLEYADPNSNATIFAEYNAISNPIRDEIGVRSLSQLTALLEGPASGAGLRQAFWTWTVKLDKEMATVTKDIFFEELPSVLDASDLFAAKVKDRAIAAAKTMDKASSYLYMNYASPYQDPVAGYGSTNQAKLKAISQKYDPTGVFEKLQPGYFKLDGTPWGTAL